MEEERCGIRNRPMTQSAEFEFADGIYTAPNFRNFLLLFTHFWISHALQTLAFFFFLIVEHHTYTYILFVV